MPQVCYRGTGLRNLTSAQAFENCEAARWRLSEGDLAEIEQQIEGLSPGVLRRATLCSSSKIHSFHKDDTQYRGKDHRKDGAQKHGPVDVQIRGL
jgi:hypothetical protein